ncbi:hypothetical protein [Marinomonas profundimaris]|uniref:Uncharacterized protein n=1 Tax=Marinomonas profundimaris TaxID=1208321 RepID=W1RT87_9GAMM|nr:hypothetical protein [Marinomonas profundimaris]ETI58083.1 hypothetical protein D104_16080 [Marinomonas profundimaris]
MLLKEIYGYDAPCLGIWPMPWYENPGYFLMYELKLINDKLKWLHRSIESQKRPGHAKADVYDDYLVAAKIAKENSVSIAHIVNGLDISDIEKSSLTLKAEKALMVKKRLMDEEFLMLQEAKKLHSKREFKKGDIKLNEPSDLIEEELCKQLVDFPYLTVVCISQYGVILLKKESDGVWVRAKKNKKAALYAYKEKIAKGFGYSCYAHWGKTKSAIRKELLPRANELLQLASVKRLLADAERLGQKVLVVGEYVFWFEADNGIGWVIKESNGVPSESSANTLWQDGEIISKNHGRIVVLPYQKEDGTKVVGHTKNAPNDQKAKPRHPDEFLELPFEILDGDLMVGLFGELPYE